jgi:alpha-D-ribose 1-methylphosphonate 5-triphosphate synthase subunit PhnG
MAVAASRPDPDPDTAARQRWMRVLALAPVERLEAALCDMADPPPARPLRPPEIGTAMVRGRAGGTGARFNLGEMTLTRCAVAIDGADGRTRVGHGAVAGRNRRHAELAALFDALLQDPARRETLTKAVIEPLAASLEQRRHEESRQAAASRVDFFTMVRGD